MIILVEKNKEAAMKELMSFQHNEFGSIRALKIKENPWFVAMDVAEILGYATTNRMTERLDDDEKAEAPLPCISSNSVKQQRIMTIINEPGLYTAIIGSHKTEVKYERIN